jgi:NAD(P)-dependent dehydrogenase (short-subunit alcohol dehydrogenase family)
VEEGAASAEALIDRSPVPDYRQLLDLSSREYLVVGAGQGMGRQVCHALAQAGARKIICADIDISRASRVAEEVGVGIPWQGDVSTAADAQALVAGASRLLDRLDGLVDIVGQASWAPIPQLTQEVWDRDFAMCLGHAYHVSQGVIDLMTSSGGGSMVFITSVSGLYGAPGHAAYGAAKAALISWVQSLAVELGPAGIRANSVAPGTVLTPRMQVMWDEAKQRAVAANAPLGRIGSTADIAGAVLFLISDLSGFITGKTLVVDGGVGSKFPYVIGAPKTDG